METLSSWTHRLPNLDMTNIIRDMVQDDSQSAVPPFDSCKSAASVESINPTASSSTSCWAECRQWLGAVQPGNWLLLTFLVGGLLQIASCVVVARVYHLTLCSVGRETVWAWLVCNVFSSPVLAILFVAATMFVRAGWAWKTVFAARAIGEATLTLAALTALRPWINSTSSSGLGLSRMIDRLPEFLVIVALYFPPLFSLAILLLLAVAVIVDLRHRTRRNWVHWLGVCCLVIGNPIAAVYWWQWVVGGTVGQLLGR